jgi:hypothetical protein
MSNPEFDERQNNFTMGIAGGNQRVNLAKANFGLFVLSVG